MSDYPPEWDEIELGEAFSVKRGDSNLTKSAYKKTGVVAFSASGPDGFVDNCQNEGDGVVISSVGAQCGKIFRASGKWTAINNTIAVTQLNQKHSIDYLFHLLDRQDILLPEGGAQPFISQKEVVGASLHFPPLPEQKKIAEILSGIDKVIANLDLQKTKHEQLFSSMLSKVFIELQETSRVCRIGDICEVKRGASPRPIQSKEWWGQGRGWTRISDVTKSKKYLYATKDRLSPAGEQKSVPIDPGGIILSICATIGLPVIPQIPVCIHDGFVWFDGIEKEVLPEFAYYFFLSVREGLLSGRQTGTQGNLNTSIVSQQAIPVPTQNEQRRIIKILSEMEFQGEKIERKIQSHIHLKSSISADLLSGRKRVSI